MKFKIIIGENIKDFEMKINDFLEKDRGIFDIKYEVDSYHQMAFILYQDAPLDKIEPSGNIGWTAPFFEEAAKILSKNKGYIPV